MYNHFLKKKYTKGVSIAICCVVVVVCVLCADVAEAADATQFPSGSAGNLPNATDGSIAVGRYANASGTAANTSIAIGQSAFANEGAVSYGQFANASGIFSVAAGFGANATNVSAVSIGYNACASGQNSVALGARSVATNDNELSVGNATLKRQITNVASAGGIVSGGTNAVNAGDVYAETRVTSAGNYLNTSSAGTAAANLAALDTAMGKVAAGNYVVASDGTDATSLAANIGKLDTAVGKQTVDGNYIKANDSSNTLATNIATLDTKLGKVTTTTNGVAQSNTFAANIDALNNTLGDQTSGITSTNYISQGADVAANLTELDKALGAKTGGTYILGTNSVNQNLAALDAAIAGGATGGSFTFGDGTNSSVIKSGNKVSFQGAAGKNITTSFKKTGNDGTIEIALNDNITLNSVTAGTGANQAVLDSRGVTVGGNTYITGSGINANNQVITNVASAGKLSESNTNAVNGADLYNATTMKNKGYIYDANDSVITAVTKVDKSIQGLTGTIGNLDDVVGFKTDASGKAVSTIRNGNYVRDGQKVSDAVNVLDSELGNVAGEMREGLAKSAALSALHAPKFEENENFALALSYGGYRNSSSGAVGAFVKAGDNVLVNAATSFGTGGAVYNAGVSVKFGPGKSYKKTVTNQDALINKLKSQDKEIAELKKQMLEMQQYFERKNMSGREISSRLSDIYDNYAKADETEDNTKAFASLKTKNTDEAVLAENREGDKENISAEKTAQQQNKKQKQKKAATTVAKPAEILSPDMQNAVQQEQKGISQDTNDMLAEWKQKNAEVAVYSQNGMTKAVSPTQRNRAEAEVERIVAQNRNYASMPAKVQQEPYKTAEKTNVTVTAKQSPNNGKKPDSNVITMQFGAYSKKEMAQKMANDVASLGLKNVKVIETVRNGKKIYKVQAFVADTAESVQKLKKKLNDTGYQVYIVK